MLARSRVCLQTITRRLADFPEANVIKKKFLFRKDTSTIKQLKGLSSGQKIVLNGWIEQKPKRVGKNLIFGLLRDSNGDIIQLVDNKSLLKGFTLEDVVQAVGILSLKRKLSNEDADEYELQLEDITVLNASNKKPAQMQDFKLSAIYPPEFRYLQLRNPKYQDFLKKRSSISKEIRNSFNNLDFTEVETPMLFKATPEGAREFLVPTRTKRSDGKPSFYALDQSPQQYKQLLMASGVNKYYQMARCFRDEDLRADRQPEFTQVDMEMAFANSEDVMKIIEKTVSEVWSKFSKKRGLLTLDSKGTLVPAKKENGTVSIFRMTYEQAMTSYGIDKPDLRAPDLKIINLGEFNAFSHLNKKFPVFEVIILRNAFSNMEEYKERWSFLTNNSNYNYRVPIVLPIENDEQANSNWFENFHAIATFENPHLITKFLKLKKGDIVCGCTREPNHSIFENPTPLGRLRQLVLQSEHGKNIYHAVNKDVASWIVDFPLFSPVIIEDKSGKKEKLAYPEYEKDRLCSTHHPFTMVKLKDYEKLEKTPEKCLGQHYDLVVNGVELGGGSTRIHDPRLQDYIFEDILKIDNAYELFGHLLNAFDMGTPPHAGFAIGFDRMCAMICETESIRDVIAFPKSITGADLVVKSPSVIPESILEPYNIKYSNSKK
ncbi:AKR_HP2_G0051340.mRNA.1.CDS.1 [Saccharomyces cerevisiae]|nr:AKR_HP2_G0051340.mRNA.1.CDS.1 [Saccharomyces cerevisiae]CAI6711340.1 AKR_HP2_G0051340.mRNA.1.CDS.1 [Saccharomyces cerevisiae]CAI6727377.1 AKR_HP1_G0053150.mRNA.1.CDS.1 [Saccharomyces cerevisiae]